MQCWILEGPFFYQFIPMHSVPILLQLCMQYRTTDTHIQDLAAGLAAATVNDSDDGSTSMEHHSANVPVLDDACMQSTQLRD